MSRRLCFEYQAPGQFEARRRFVIVDGTCRKKKSLFVTARGGEEKKGWRASASIACSPTLLSAVCFPSGPFCFSSISDLATLSLRLRVTPNSTLIFTPSPPSPVCCRSVIRVNKHLTSSHCRLENDCKRVDHRLLLLLFFFLKLLVGYRISSIRLLCFNIFLSG